MTRKVPGQSEKPQIQENRHGELLHAPEEAAPACLHTPVALGSNTEFSGMPAFRQLQQTNSTRIGQKDPNQGSARGPQMLEVGWELWLKSAPWERDFFLPVPTKTLDHWERYECKYAEATVLSQVLEAELSINREKVMCKGVPGRLWREHSPRAFQMLCVLALSGEFRFSDHRGLSPQLCTLTESAFKGALTQHGNVSAPCSPKCPNCCGRSRNRVSGRRSFAKLARGTGRQAEESQGVCGTSEEPN